MNHFEVFELPRKLGIDTVALQRTFYELSRRYHPDFHQGATAEAQAEALEASARLNSAYRVLRDPLARADYLVRLEEGRETKEGATGKPAAPAALLEEMFEIQEALHEAKAGTLDAGARAVLMAQRDRLLERQRQEEARVSGPLAQAWDAADGPQRPAALAVLKEALATRAYLRTVIDDLGGALGEGDETHVAHHRH